MGELLLRVRVGGIGLTVTFTIPAGLVQPSTVCVTEYVPLPARVMLPIVGFCTAEVKLFGPFHK
jgi:hypothetical protein